MIDTKIIDLSTGLDILQPRARNLHCTCAMLVIF